MKYTLTSLLALSAPFASAIRAPDVDGMKVLFSDDFHGPSGTLPKDKNWIIAEHINTNDELQTYSNSTDNIQLSGGETLQLVPWKGKDGKWTSGRVETQKAWSPSRGKKLRFQAGIRTGSNEHKNGMWPALWMLGDAVHHGTEWPECGELDIFEEVNGDGTAWATVHCDQEKGGICDEPTGIRASTDISGDNDEDFHDWALVIDRTPKKWESETIQWSKDGNVFKTLKGSDIGDEKVWATLAHAPYYILMNVAVGGTWPGDPDDNTQDGYGSMMEVSYVSVYESH